MLLGGKRCVSFYNSQQTLISGTSTTSASSLSSQLHTFPLLFHRMREEISTLLFAAVHHVCRLWFGTCWKPFPPASPPQVPGKQLLVNRRQKRKGRSQWHAQVGQPQDALQQPPDLNQQHWQGGSTQYKQLGIWQAEEGGNQTFLLPPEGPGCPPSQGQHISVSSLMLSLPLFHEQACLLMPLSFLPRDGFISGVQACPSHGEPTIMMSLVQEKSFPYWNFYRVWGRTVLLNITRMQCKCLNKNYNWALSHLSISVNSYWKPLESTCSVS